MSATEHQAGWTRRQGLLPPGLTSCLDRRGHLRACIASSSEHCQRFPHGARWVHSSSWNSWRVKRFKKYFYRWLSDMRAYGAVEPSLGTARMRVRQVLFATSSCDGEVCVDTDTNRDTDSEHRQRGTQTNTGRTCILRRTVCWQPACTQVSLTVSVFIPRVLC